MKVIQWSNRIEPWTLVIQLTDLPARVRGKKGTVTVVEKGRDDFEWREDTMPPEHTPICLTQKPPTDKK